MLVSETWKLIQSSGRMQSWHRDGLDIMRSPASLTCRPQYHCGAVALHNRVLHIISVLQFFAIC